MSWEDRPAAFINFSGFSFVPWDIPHVVYIKYYVATTCGGSPCNRTPWYGTFGMYIPTLR